MQAKKKRGSSIGRRLTDGIAQQEGAAIPQLLAVVEAAPLLGMSERQLREQIWRGHIRAVKIGHHVRIPLRAIEELINGDVASGDG